MNKNKETLLNAVMMHFRAEAAKTAATIDTILENPHGSVEGTNYVDALIENVQKLATYDTSMKVLHGGFISPLAEARRKSSSAADPAQTMQQEMAIAAAEALNKRAAKTDIYPKGKKNIPAKKKSND